MAATRQFYLGDLLLLAVGLPHLPLISIELRLRSRLIRYLIFMTSSGIDDVGSGGVWPTAGPEARALRLRVPDV